MFYLYHNVIQASVALSMPDVKTNLLHKFVFPDACPSNTVFCLRQILFKNYIFLLHTLKLQTKPHYSTDLHLSRQAPDLMLFACGVGSRYVKITELPQGEKRYEKDYDLRILVQNGHYYPAYACNMHRMHGHSLPHCICRCHISGGNDCNSIRLHRCR